MFNRLRALASAATFTVAVLAACTTPTPKPAATAPAPIIAPVPQPKSGLDLTGFDRSVRPQDDLYRFAGGAWLANTEIPADRSNYGASIILGDQAREEVKQLIVAASTQPNRPVSSVARAWRWCQRNRAESR